MSYNLKIRPLAAKEILEAYDRYEGRKDGLGKRCLEALDAFFEVLLGDPVIHAYYEAPLRQGILQHFPYVVVYEVTGEQIVVYSVFMTDQYPAKKRTG